MRTGMSMCAIDLGRLDIDDLDSSNKLLSRRAGLGWRSKDALLALHCFSTGTGTAQHSTAQPSMHVASGFGMLRALRINRGASVMTKMDNQCLACTNALCPGDQTSSEERRCGRYRCDDLNVSDTPRAIASAPWPP